MNPQLSATEPGTIRNLASSAGCQSIRNYPQPEQVASATDTNGDGSSSNGNTLTNSNFTNNTNVSIIPISNVITTTGFPIRAHWRSFVAKTS